MITIIASVLIDNLMSFQLSGSACPNVECPSGSKAACILDGTECTCKCGEHLYPMVKAKSLGERVAANFRGVDKIRAAH